MKQTLRLTSADQVVAALGAQEAVVRLKVAEAVRDRPELVSRYGVDGAHAIVDSLWQRLHSETRSPVRAIVLQALCTFPADAVLLRCIEALSVPQHPLAVEVATILANRNPAQLPPSLRIRVWLLTEDLPAVEASLVPEFSGTWVAELAGENRPLAQRVLGRFRERALAFLAPCCERFDPNGLAWLVGLLDPESLTHHLDLLRTALRSDSAQVLAAAAAVCAACGDQLPQEIRLLAERLRDCPHSEVRIAACRLPADAAGWMVRYRRETDPRVRAASLRAAPANDLPGIDVLTSALESGDWRERSAAIDAFVGMGAPAIAHLRGFVLRGADAGGAGAWQALARLGDEAWLTSQELGD